MRSAAKPKASHMTEPTGRFSAVCRKRAFLLGTVFSQKTSDYDDQSGLGGKFSESFFSFEITSIKKYSPK